MKVRRSLIVPALALLAMAAPAPLAAQAQPKGSLEGMTAPKPDVPEIFTLAGAYVRMAYNNEGYAVIGYRMVQEEVGNPWALLAVGVTLRGNTKPYTMPRTAFSLQTPDGKTLPLPTQQEYMKADVRALNMLARNFNDNINYFPAGANRPCPMQFFANVDRPGLAYDSVDLTTERDCLGRLYFNIPGGIQVGQYFLNVKFASSTIQVPFRVFTKEQAKDFSKQWEDLKKAHDASYK
ncbi:MAG: hypothetical protein IPL89_10590 [Acidobacteria bacterium]|nr:hypothetical protein [Acidobacteriota bacterium]